MSFPDLVFIGDHDAIKQILLTILDKTLKHSAEEIRLIAKPVKGWCEVRVQDQGEGIPPERLDRIFDRFYRAEDASTIRALADGQGRLFASKAQSVRAVILQFPVWSDRLSVDQPGS